MCTLHATKLWLIEIIQTAIADSRYQKYTKQFWHKGQRLLRWMIHAGKDYFGPHLDSSKKQAKSLCIFFVGDFHLVNTCYAVIKKDSDYVIGNGWNGNAGEGEKEKETMFWFYVCICGGGVLLWLLTFNTDSAGCRTCCLNKRFSC